MRVLGMGAPTPHGSGRVHAFTRFTGKCGDESRKAVIYVLYAGVDSAASPGLTGKCGDRTQYGRVIRASLHWGPIPLQVRLVGCRELI